LLGSRAISIFMRLTASLVAARLVAPEQMGLVAWLGIVTFYAPWLTLGVTYGAERLVPLYRGKGEAATGERLWSHALKSVTVSSLICLAGGAAVLAACFCSSPETAWKLYWGAFFSALVLLCLLGMTYLTAEKKFRQLQRLFLIESALWWLFLPLVLLGVAGLRARLILASVLPLMLVWRMTPQQIKPCRMDSSELRLLIRNGFPILTANFIVIPLALKDLLNPDHHWWVYLPVLLLSVAAMVPFIIVAERKKLMKGVMPVPVAIMRISCSGGTSERRKLPTMRSPT